MTGTPGRSTQVVEPEASPHHPVLAWLRRRWRRRGRLSPEQRRAVLDAVALRPSATWTFRFAVLQALSVVIAVMGLTTNSAAVVIGAMLVAPLMGPIMGISASLAMTWGSRAIRSTVLVGSAAVGSVALAYLLNAAVPGNGLTNEVLARTAPGATDLVIALAAGLAGAYATVRPEISSSLPGVAVAVALVPPLGAVGVTWQAGEHELAVGALVLFVTNLAAIVFAGLVVFPATGFVPIHRLKATGGTLAVRATMVTAVVGLLAALLTGRSVEAARHAEEVADARRMSASWLVGSGLDLTDVTIDGEQVTVAVSGPEPPPEPSALARQMIERLGPETQLEIQWLQRSSIAANGNGAPALAADVVADEVALWLAETGVDVEQFDIDVVVENRTVELAVAGPVSPPDSRILERRLAERFAVAVAVAVDATVVVPDADEVATRNAVLDAAASWAGGAGLVVNDAIVDGDTVTVDVEGPSPPPGSRPLADMLTEALGRPVELVVRHRTLVAVPLDPPSTFRWPLDCASGSAPGATTGSGPGGTTEATDGDGPVGLITGASPGGFTATSLGEWLANRLAATGQPFIDDGSSFAQVYADGTLHVWAGSTIQYPGPDRREVGPLAIAHGPRGAELRTARAGGAVILAAVVPHPAQDDVTTECLPATDALDGVFDGLVAAADGARFTGTALAALGAVPPLSLPDGAALRTHVFDVALRNGLPVAVDADGELWIRAAAGDRRLDVAAAHMPVDTSPGSVTRRSGGVTVSVVPEGGGGGDASGIDQETTGTLDRLVVGLRAAPFVGQPPPLPDQLAGP